VIVFFAALAAQACSITYVNIAPTGRVPPREPLEKCTTEVYVGEYPKRPYVQMAMVTGDANPFASMAYAQEEMRKEACEIGADALIVHWPSAVAWAYRPSMSGVAIVFTSTVAR
jgi:hypothetical protein